jgi:hypothetical protein
MSKLGAGCSRGVLVVGLVLLQPADVLVLPPPPMGLLPALLVLLVLLMLLLPPPPMGLLPPLLVLLLVVWVWV